MKRALVALVAVTAAVLAGAGAAQEPAVTLEVRSVPQPSGAFNRHLFAGRISSGAGGQLVTVLGKACPRNNLETSIAGATTNPGGGWDAEAAGQRTRMTYRARWGERFSEPVVVWEPMFVNAARMSARSIIVFVDTAAAFQDLAGKYIQLQRFNRPTGTWRFYKRAKLKRNSSGFSPYNFQVTFTKLPKGATLRAYVPRKLAAPCYQPRASDKITLT